MLLYRLPISKDLAVTLDHYDIALWKLLHPLECGSFDLWLVAGCFENVIIFLITLRLQKELHKDYRHLPYVVLEYTFT